jgi:hypothetical protein
MQSRMAVVLASVTFITATLHNFVSWNSGSKLWMRCAPSFYFWLAIFTYIVVPVFYVPWVLLCLLPAAGANTSIHFSWNLTFAMLSFAQFINFFIEIKARFMREKVLHDARKQIEALIHVQPLLNSSAVDEQLINE